MSFETRPKTWLATTGLVAASLPHFRMCLEIIDYEGILVAGGGFEPPTFGL
jgi:hypothetical protein